jgi:hypothetical protein
VLLLPLLLAGWLLAPAILAYGGMITGATFFGEPPSAAERSESTALLRAAGATAFCLPLAGLLLSRWLRRRALTWVFAVALLVSAVPAAVLLLATG